MSEWPTVSEEFAMYAARHKKDMDATFKSTRVMKMEWQPIETAPRDDTSILVIHDEEIKIAHWDQGFKYWDSFNYCDRSDSDDPTHWMPLPAIPEDLK